MSWGDYGEIIAGGFCDRLGDDMGKMFFSFMKVLVVALDLAIIFLFSLIFLLYWGGDDKYRVDQ